MEEKKHPVPEEELAPESRTGDDEQAPPQEVKSAWQQTKEGWYDKIPLTLKQLDIIVACCFAALILTAIAIALDAMGVF